MRIQFSSNIPIYRQIIDMIKRMIIIGRIKPGDKLLSIREMSSNLKVNPNTIQRAYQELERLGITYTQRGTGNFVKEDITMVNKLKNEMAGNVIKEFIYGMKNLGFTGQEIIEIIQKKVKSSDLYKEER